MELKGKIAVITGAGRLGGVGAATAHLLAAAGCNIVLNCLNETPEIYQIANECKNLSIEASIFIGDLTDESVCNDLAKFSAKESNCVDFLINCLGYSESIPMSRLDLVDAALFQKILAINTIAPFLLAKAFQPFLTNSSNAAIVNISSTAGFTGKSSSLPYSVAKGALNTLTLSLSQALSPKVRVNAVCPSFIDSSWWRGKFMDPAKYEALKQSMSQNNLLNRVLSPDDVALAILSIIKNPAITGELIRLDAGAHIGSVNK